MRILHTADWHLGNAMHTVDRSKEQEQFLNWLTQVIKDEKIEALIVAGDIFDTYGPPNWSLKLFYHFLSSLWGSDCHNVVVVGGNHDSGNLLDAPSDIFDVLNIHVVGNASNKTIEEMVFELKDEKGNTSAICAAVPYVSDIYLEDYCEGRSKCPDKTFSDITYSELYNAFLKKVLELKKDKDIPLIATGHLYAAGLEGRYEGQEEEIKTDDGVRQLDVVGNLGKVHINAFPTEFDYVALGHIHYQTRVGGSEKIRYSGSPFVMGFDEGDIKHYVLRVDLGNEANPHALNVKKIEVPTPVLFFKRISGTVGEIREELNDVIREAIGNDDHEKYCIELYYSAEDSIAVHTLVEKMNFPEKVSVVSWKVKRLENDYTADFGSYDIRSISTIEPEDIIRQLVLSKIHIEKGDLTEEEYRKKQDEVVNKYMPYFMAAFIDAEKNGGPNEDT